LLCLYQKLGPIPPEDSSLQRTWPLSYFPTVKFFTYPLVGNFLSIWCCMSWLWFAECFVFSSFYLVLSPFSFTHEITMIETTICLACRLWPTWPTHFIAEKLRVRIISGLYKRSSHNYWGYCCRWNFKRLRWWILSPSSWGVHKLGNAPYASHCADCQLWHV
jgi:hypothetical protein